MVAALAIAAHAFPATADTKRVQEDVAHDASTAKLDIKWVQHGHSGRKLAHVISTYDTWRNADLGDNGKFQINISPGPDNPSVTRIVVIYLDQGKMEAKFFDLSHGSEVKGYPPVTRPTARSVKVVFPKRWVRKGLKAYKWEALYAEDNVKDTVPGDRFILHSM